MSRRLAVAAAALVAGLGVVSVVPASADAAASFTWTATPLPVPAGVFSVRVNGTDRGNQVVGGYDTFEGGQHRPGVLWRNGELIVLGEASGQLTELTAVNTSGVAVGGHFGFGSPGRRAMRFVVDHYEDLPVPEGTRDSMATSVNARGDIAGTVDGRLIVWRAGDPAGFQLPLMPFDSFTSGVGIGDDGTVVGSVLEPVGSGPNRAFRWDVTGQFHELDRVDQDAEHSTITIAGKRIAGHVSPFGGVVWGLRGHIRRDVPNTLIYAMNTRGHLLARGNDGPWFLLRHGNRIDLPNEFLPSGGTTLTDDDSVAGYSFVNGVQTPVLWRLVRG